MPGIPEYSFATAEPTSTAPRFFVADSDNMQPTIQLHETVAVLPIDDYRAEGIYVLDFGHHPGVYRCAIMPSGDIDVIRDNRAYQTTTITRDEFREAVLGKVFAICRTIDGTLLEMVRQVPREAWRTIGRA